MTYDMNLRLRELMTLRLEDVVGDPHHSTDVNPMARLVRLLCESCLWLLRDWPKQKIDDLERVRASRLDAQERLRKLLRARPHKDSELDGLILILSDAILTISEQWPGSEAESEDFPYVVDEVVPTTPQLSQQSESLESTRSPIAEMPKVDAPPEENPRDNICEPSPAKRLRIDANPRYMDECQRPSTSHAIPPPAINPARKQHKEKHQANNAPSALWAYFTKVTGETGMHLGQCMICRRLIPRHKYGTSGMKTHLRVHHPSEFISLGMESRESSQNSLTVASEAEPRRTTAKEKATTSVSAIVAALNRPTGTRIDASAPLFGDSVKEEEPDYDEAANHNRAESEDNFEEPSSSQQQPSSAHLRGNRGASDIWSYFRKEDVNEDKHGCCMLCGWTRKIYNHGTNTMWAHLKRQHPYEYSVLKPFEFHPTIAYKPGEVVPSHLTLPRPPPSMEDGQEL
ncbi:hypothetical protein PMAYCL1PPCAC_32048 [Pristionchus mayeri]|uniref:BED-type domain-containing protein n=1 Tax=Pristionchus mayeri TaxID=1317129 RepID=A0AAN5DES2_9BILA|nr:hypothetical protein PMAYCL1PPCAC_32048 [Pristionchus mayeri]